MEDKITFLSKLNRELKVIEKQIVDRAIAYLHIAEARLKGNDLFTTDYEVEARVAYYLNTEIEAAEPVHTYWHNFRYKDIIIDKDYYMLLDNGNGTDCFKEGRNIPELDSPYCYLLHDLINHSNLKPGNNIFDFERLGDKIYDLERIWVDVEYKDQKGIKINGDGSSRKLLLDGNGFV